MKRMEREKMEEERNAINVIASYIHRGDTLLRT